MSGEESHGGIPECFGEVMGKLEHITGVGGPDACLALSDKMLPEKVT